MEDAPEVFIVYVIIVS